MALSENPQPQIVVRLVVDGPVESAQTVWKRVRLELASLATPEEVSIKPYWKFPNSSEMTCVLRPVPTPDRAFEEIALRLGTGWAEDADDQFARWTVWNRGNGNFIMPSVVWAHLELIRL